MIKLVTDRTLLDNEPTRNSSPQLLDNTQSLPLDAEDPCGSCFGRDWVKVIIYYNSFKVLKK